MKPYTAYASAVIDAPIERVWSYLRDFNGLPALLEIVTASELEAGGGPQQVGTVRRLTLPDGFVRERLLRFDEPNFEFEYAIIESSMPVRDYVASVALAPVTDTGRTFAQWGANFSADSDDVRNAVAATLNEQVFAATFRSIAQKIAQA